MCFLSNHGLKTLTIQSWVSQIWFYSIIIFQNLEDLIPILKSLSKVKDVRKIIRQVSSKMTISVSEFNKNINDMYQKDRNIKIDDRVAYQAIMGNYYPPQEEYNPKRLKTIFLK